jgi:AcrR family transcriptional regulator
MTSGNGEETPGADGTRSTAERLIEATLELIAERGGSTRVNLREVARRVGCAHTNVYNHFAGYDDLLWAAFRRVLVLYGRAMSQGLDDACSPSEYYRRLVTNLAGFPQECPGLYRFIGSDPFGGSQIPPDVLETVAVMKQWMCDAFQASAPGISADAAADTCYIVYAYLDGESFNLINERTVPGEDVEGRMVDNAVRLFALLTGDEGSRTGMVERPPYPDLPLAECPPM